MSCRPASGAGYRPGVPSASEFAAYTLASFLLVVVPGPSVLFVISRGVALGRKAALATVVGNAAGVYLQALLVAVGLGAVISRSAVVFTTIKLAGAAYLVYLGVQAFRHRRALSSVLDATDVRPTSPRRLELLGGAGGLTMIGLGVGLAASGGRRT